MDIPSYLMEHGGPILRWRTATDLLPAEPGLDRARLFTEMLGCSEVLHWLSLLGTGPVHHSKDSAAENALAKLCEYGLHAGLPELDARALPYCAVAPGEPYYEEAIIIVPFLVRAGYAGEPRVAEWMQRRIDILYGLACRGEFDLYMDDDERECLPPSQRLQYGSPKLFYKQRFNHHWGYLALPTCYDLYALAYYPNEDPAIRQKIEAIVAYLLHPAFQETPGGYIWNAALHRPYAAGRVFLACLPRDTEHEKLVLFMEMLAQFACGRSSEWFRKGMAHLESFRTPRGTYRFPRKYLSEKPASYLYGGMHMGLGESPRDARALELESTFRMARVNLLAAL